MSGELCSAQLSVMKMVAGPCLVSNYRAFHIFASIMHSVLGSMHTMHDCGEVSLELAVSFL